MKVLCVNTGSSSLKFEAYEMPEEKVLISGYVEKIGLKDCFWTIKINGQKIKKAEFLKDHISAVKVIIKELMEYKIISTPDEIKGIGHRIVHGGEKYKNSTIINNKVIKDINILSKFAIQHHYSHLIGIDAMKKSFPNALQVAIFDTAFHQTIPEENYLFPVPYEWYKKYKVRKYGFHGTSHKYITEVMKQELDKNNVNLITCHIGSGASIACIKDSISIDTSMGLTPLDGLMMGTRCGSIDPSIIEYICSVTGKTAIQVTTDLNKKSGLFGMTGLSDCRDVEELADSGNERAILALNMYCDRIASYIAKYYLELKGNIDSIVFTAGVGENSPKLREQILNILSPLGIIIDKEQNNLIYKGKSGVITSNKSKIRVDVIPTNEELIIAKDTYNFLKNKK